MQTHISDILGKREKILRVFAKKAAVYIDEIRNYIMSIDIDSYNKYNVALDKIEAFNIADVLSIGANMLSISNLYTLLAEIDTAIEYIIKIVSNETYIQIAVNNLSSSRAIDVYHIKSDIISAYTSYKDCAVDDDKLFDQIWQTLPQSSIYDFIINNANIINKFTIAAIGYLLTKSIEYRRALELLIEKQKDTILGVMRITSFNLSRYNLRPITSLMSIQSLFKSLGFNYRDSISIDENITLNNIIALYNITKSPIDYDMRGSIDLNYVTQHGLQSTLLTGLNKKIIERYSAGGRIADNIERPIEKIIQGDITSQKWYVLETIDGNLWRALGLFNGTLVAQIDMNNIIGLIRGMTTRPYQYNKLCAETIISRCLDPQAENILRDYQNEPRRISSDAINTAIVNHALDIFARKVNAIKSISDFRDIIYDESLIESCLLTALSNTGTSFENIITQIYSINESLYKFKNILEKYIVNINDRIFSEDSRSEINRILTNVYKIGLEKTVSELSQGNEWATYDTTVKEYFIRNKYITK